MNFESIKDLLNDLDPAFILENLGFLERDYMQLLLTHPENRCTPMPDVANAIWCLQKVKDAIKGLETNNEQK